MKPEQKASKPTNQMVDLCLGIALKAHAGQADLDGVSFQIIMLSLR